MSLSDDELFSILQYISRTPSFKRVSRQFESTYNKYKTKFISKDVYHLISTLNYNNTMSIWNTVNKLALDKQWDILYQIVELVLIEKYSKHRILIYFIMLISHYFDNTDLCKYIVSKVPIYDYLSICDSKDIINSDARASIVISYMKLLNVIYFYYSYLLDPSVKNKSKLVDIINTYITTSNMPYTIIVPIISILDTDIVKSLVKMNSMKGYLEESLMRNSMHLNINISISNTDIFIPIEVPFSNKKTLYTLMVEQVNMYDLLKEKSKENVKDIFSSIMYKYSTERIITPSILSGLHNMLDAYKFYTDEEYPKEELYKRNPIYKDYIYLYYK